MNSQTFRYVLVTGWALLMLCLPFIFTASLFFPFITGKNIFFRVIVDILLVLWMVSCIQDKSLRPKWGWLLGIFAGFTVWVGIADTVGIDPLRSFWSNFERMEGYITILHLFALFLVSATSLTKDLWYKLIAWSVIISGFTWIQGMVEHFDNKAFRIDGSFGNAVYFAAYALIHIFFSIILAIKYRAYKYFWIVLALCNLTTILYSGTRGAFLAVMGGSVLIAFLYLILRWKHAAIRIAAASVLGIIALGTVLLGFGWQTNFIASSPVLSRFGQLAHYVVTLDFKGLVDDIGRSRTAIWGIAWEGAKERPITGWGQENFIQVFSKHYDPKIFDQEQWFDRTHNVFFDWLISAGFVGLFGYLGIFAAMLWYLWKREEFDIHEKILLTGLCLAYFIHTFFVFDNITTYIFIMLILAMVHAVSAQHRTVEVQHAHMSHDKHHKHAKRNKGHDRTHNAPQLVIVGLIAAIALAWAVNVPVASTGSDLIKGLRFSYGDGSKPADESYIKESKKYFEEALVGAELAKTEIREQLVDVSYRVRSSSAATTTKAEFLDMVTAQIEANIAAHPDDARILYFAGVYYNSMNNFAKSVAALERAVALSPQKQTFMFLLADIYDRAGNKEKAVELYKRAYEADTTFIEPRLRYVNMLISAGKKTEAEALMKDISVEALLDTRYVNLLMAVNRYDIIVQIFENVLKQNPADVQAKISLAAAHVELGQRDKAIEVLQSIVKDMPEAKAEIEKLISEIRAGRNPIQK